MSSTRFDESGFLKYLACRGYTAPQKIVATARQCMSRGVTTSDGVNEITFPGLAWNTRSHYKNALRRYEEYLQRESVETTDQEVVQ